MPGGPLRLDDGLVDAFAGTLDEPDLDHAFVAQALTLPSETYVAEQMAEIDVDGIHAVREFLRGGARRAARATAWLETYRTLQTQRAVPLRGGARSGGARSGTWRSPICWPAAGRKAAASASPSSAAPTT